MNIIIALYCCIDDVYLHPSRISCFSVFRLIWFRPLLEGLRFFFIPQSAEASCLSYYYCWIENSPVSFPICFKNVVAISYISHKILLHLQTSQIIINYLINRLATNMKDSQTVIVIVIMNMLGSCVNREIQMHWYIIHNNINL